MGYSRDTFYRYRQTVDEGGFAALVEQSRRKPNLRNRVAAEIEEAVVTLATEQPALGQVRVSNELRRRGQQISPAGVRGVWLRHGLETFKKRLVALEKKVAKEGVILTEGQLAALERQRHDDEAVGEIAEHPGYLGSQDTFYVGTLKGVGRIYQQTFVDTYSKWASAKLYPAKTAITAADLLNDRVLPFFEVQGAEMLRILTDRGTEFCGRHDEHPYQLFLAVNDIDHTKTKVKSPQTNGICERTRPSCRSSIRSRFGKSSTAVSSSSRWTSMRGSSRTMSSGHTKARCAVDVHRVRRSTMACVSGRRG